MLEYKDLDTGWGLQSCLADFSRTDQLQFWKEIKAATDSIQRILSESSKLRRVGSICKRNRKCYYIRNKHILFVFMLLLFFFRKKSFCKQAERTTARTETMALSSSTTHRNGAAVRIPRCKLHIAQVKDASEDSKNSHLVGITNPWKIMN